MQKLTVKYSCTLCGLHRVTCGVEQRVDGQDIVEWMESLGEALSRDHDKRSPGCHPKSLSEVMIPLPDDGDPIGKTKPS